MLGTVYTTGISATGAAQFFNPARFSLIDELVEPAERAHGMGQAT